MLNGRLTTSKINIESKISNLQDRLPKILSVQHSHQSFSSIIHPISHTTLDHNFPSLDPLLHICLMFNIILRRQIRICDNEPSDAEVLAGHQSHVLDAISIFWLFAALGDTAAYYLFCQQYVPSRSKGTQTYPPKITHRRQGSIKCFPSYIIVVDIQPPFSKLSQQPLQRITGPLLLIIESSIKT